MEHKIEMPPFISQSEGLKSRFVVAEWRRWIGSDPDICVEVGYKAEARSFYQDPSSSWGFGLLVCRDWMSACG